MPIAIRIIPPSSSLRRLMRLPKYTPSNCPTIDNIKDTKPMIRIGVRIDASVFIPVHANDIPTANASMLVATAMVKITFSL